MHDHFTVSAGLVLSNKKQPTKFEGVGCVDVWLFGKFGIRRNKENDCSIRKRNAGLVCLLSLPGAESNHFWKRMLQLLRNVQGSESQIMSETNHTPSIPVFRLEMMQLDGRG